MKELCYCVVVILYYLLQPDVKKAESFKITAENIMAIIKNKDFYNARGEFLAEK